MQPPTQLSSGGRALSRFAIAVPFFLGAALYLSVVFSAFAALPLLYAYFRSGRWAGLVATVTNTGLVYLAAGRLSAAIFFVTAVVLAGALSEGLRAKMKLEVAVAFTVGTMVLATAVLVFSYSHKYGVNPIKRVDSVVGEVVDQVAKNVEKYRASAAITNQDLEKFLIDPEMTKKNIVYELPSAMVIFMMILVIGNLMLGLRLNFCGLRDHCGLAADFFKHWKAPDHLVWPTLLAGFFLVVEIPVASEVALNCFKVLLAIYALQGLAITNFLFDIWGVKGFFRPLGYFVSVALLLPLVISLGFFDLWFEFREKLKV